MTDPTHRQILDDIIADAHDRLDGRTAHVKLAVLEAMQELEASGAPWVTATLDRWAASGASRAYADWRRRQGEVEAKTAKGTAVSLPAYAAVRRANPEGRAEFHQLTIADMGLTDVDQVIERLQKSRNTYSREITVWRDVRALLADGTCSTVGDALARLVAA